MHCMPQSATLNPFRAPIPAIPHFNFGFRPEIFENLSKTLKRSGVIGICNVQKSCSNILSLLMFWFDFITANTAFNTEMNR